MENRSTIFLAFSIGDSSISTLFSKLALQLSEQFHVVIFSDRKVPFNHPSDYIETVYWPSPRPTKLKDFLFLRKKIRKYRPSLLLSTFGANNIFLVMGSIMGVPNRVASHQSVSRHFRSSKFKEFRKKWVYGKATQIITNSHATKEDVVDLFGQPENKVKVIHFAVANPSIANERDPHLIAYAGRLSENKGIPILLKAMAQVVKSIPQIKLELMGGPREMVAKYEKLAKELEVQEQVTFYGSQAKGKVLDLFSKAQVVVVPSLSEGFGLVVIEAFSVKTPVIGSATGGILEIVRDGKDGFLVPPGDEGALATQILDFFKKDKAQEIYGSNAYEWFLENFELNKVVATMASYVSHLIEGKN